MKFSVKIILGVVAFVALCLVYYSDNYFSHKKEEKKEEYAKALFFKAADVLKFTLKNANGNFVFTREKNTSDWKMLEPLQINADQDAVANTVASLGQINVQQELAGTENFVSPRGLTTGSSNKNMDPAVKPRDDNGLAQFGLDNPKVTVSVTLENKKTLTLELGSSVDIGAKNAGKSNPVSVYALNLDRLLVLVVDATNPNALANKSFSDFRTKRLAIFKPKDVAAISISSKGTNVSIEKKLGKWNVVAPVKAVGDEGFISSFMQTYQSLQAINVIEKNELAHVGLQKYGLKIPAAIVKFMDAQGKVYQEFDIGITKEAVFMQMPDGAVAQFNLVSWPDYVPKAVKFQNRQVLLGLDTNKITAIQLNSSLFYLKKDSSWYKSNGVTTPIKPTDKPNTNVLSFFSNFEFMTADDVISAPSKADLGKFGFNKPFHKFSFILGGDSKLPAIEITVGNRVPLNDKSVYIKRSDLPSVFVVSADWLPQLEKLYNTTKN